MAKLGHYLRNRYISIITEVKEIDTGKPLDQEKQASTFTSKVNPKYSSTDHGLVDSVSSRPGSPCRAKKSVCLGREVLVKSLVREVPSQGVTDHK